MLPGLRLYSARHKPHNFATLCERDGLSLPARRASSLPTLSVITLCPLDRVGVAENDDVHQDASVQRTEMVEWQRSH